MIRSLLREPLLHFLVGAAAIVALQQSVGEEEPRPDVIVVDRAALLRTLQARQGRYEAGEAEAALFFPMGNGSAFAALPTIPVELAS